MSTAAIRADESFSVPARTGKPRPGFQRAMLAVGFLLYAALLGAAWWALMRLMPDRLAFHVGGHAFALSNVHGRVLANAALVLALLPASLWIECMVVGWARSSCRALLTGTSLSGRSDLACFLLDQLHVMGLLGRAMMLGASMISGLWLRDWLGAHLGFTVDAGSLPVAVQLPFFFSAYTFCDYWTHRVGHLHYFWPLHRYHHAAREFFMVTADRAHPAGFAEIVLITVPMAVLGAQPDVMLIVNVIVIAHGFLIHSRIESDFGWFGRYVLQSPLHHRLHHKLDMSQPTGHFGIMPVWDRLFGTWSGRSDKGVAIGVDTDYRQGFWVIPDLFRDYCDFWKGLAGQRTIAPSERQNTHSRMGEGVEA
jgi:sterol desaturase/sphingolipid hydroxylase (fatty acid hydroxylase superfamily)